MKRAQAGFTLVEVVVAFAILALSAVAIYESFSLSLSQTQKLIDRRNSSLVAQSILERAGVDLRLQNGKIQKGIEGRHRWQLTPTLLEPPAGRESSALPAFSVEVTVDAVTLSKLVLQPVT